MVTDNPSRPHGFGRLDPETTVPFQKNPVIGSFFRQIDRADELGSGMRKMMLYGKKYGGTDPDLIEGDVFRTVISIPEYGANPAEKYDIVQVKSDSGAQEAQVGLLKWQVDILQSCLVNERSGKEILEIAGYKSRTGNFKKGLQKLINFQLLEMTIPDKPKSRLQKYRLTEKGRKYIGATNGRE